MSSMFAQDGDLISGYNLTFWNVLLITAQINAGRIGETIIVIDKHRI